MPRPPRPPPERTETARARIREVLGEGVPLTLKELSARVGLPERDLPAHLEHLGKSLQAEGGALIVEPSECLACGFTFSTIRSGAGPDARQRFTRPGKCPQCRRTRIRPPRVSIA